MYINTNFEKLWFLYTTEGQPKGISINTYYAQQDIPYKSFYDWLRKRQKKVVPVCGGPSRRRGFYSGIFRGCRLICFCWLESGLCCQGFNYGYYSNL
ncbi:MULTISPECIES: hypothetical protein [Bacteroides]|uniref:hypothetical protein n=1 Tax=Bacteroides TaxID=816 RepID=UPI001F185D36|nr:MULTISPECIES: hypothetical protein [Bacteroides]MCS2335787.1 hypothetical protein [Bacteroides sp. BFG-606]